MPRKTRRSIMLKRKLDFTGLVDAVRQVCERSAAVASRAVNVSLTLRNWLVGFYIVEYEQHGTDRAKYGERLLENLSAALGEKGVSRVEARELRRYRRFYLVYPQIRESVTPEMRPLLPVPSRTPRKIRETPSPNFGTPGKTLISTLSFSHFAELIEIDDSFKRSFYEIECIRGNWSVRSLKRQIASLYFERSGLSRDKKKLAALVRAGAERAEPNVAIRDPYVFEFLGIKPKEVMSESSLEDALLDKLQEFLLELGYGFCFEARQKSILIGKTRGFVDLVFYHRILKCHILVELKVDEFRHEHMGQLNTYVTWCRKHMMVKGDNPPVGLLLCAQKDHALVEYALAGMNNRLFVSKYQMVLPSKEDLQRFLEAQRRELVDE